MRVNRLHTPYRQNQDSAQHAERSGDPGSMSNYRQHAIPFLESNLEFRRASSYLGSLVGKEILHTAPGHGLRFAETRPAGWSVGD
jgi:hypothetical protein